MKRTIIYVALFFVTLNSVLAISPNETAGCSFNFICGPKLVGGDVRFYAAIIAVRLGLDIGVDSELKSGGENKFSYYVEPNIGYFYCMEHCKETSHIYASVGLKTFDTKKRDFYTSPDLYNSITVRVGYASFFNDYVGINAEIKVDTYSINYKKIQITHKNFYNGITATIGIVFKM
jgi:hypothetical protein